MQTIGHAYPWTLYSVLPASTWTLVAYADGKRRALWAQNQSDTDMYLTVGDSDTVAPVAGQAGVLLKAVGANATAVICELPLTRQALWAKCSGSGKILVLGITSDNPIVEPSAGVSSSTSSASSYTPSSASTSDSASSASASTASSASASSASSGSSGSPASASSATASSVTASISSASASSRSASSLSTEPPASVSSASGV